ncbi:helix-turn-helix domain-containing protein [Bradyrhizobium macuxiense]|uniref:helix-turn-helix domain-containing protein n=1 Tax=Bradyrhizobium macuxiense TaxID=1755647 RepID=UPI0024BF8496|nr:helix-turn-helix domain-containing protein [Bradyrhizobium macuxiense]
MINPAALVIGASRDGEVVAEGRGLAAARLIDPRSSGRSISTIAFEAGFGDLSYFNRTFRLRYGATPSDIRTAPHLTERAP